MIGLICFSIATGSTLGAQNLLAQRDLVTHVFGGSNSRSATRPKIDRAQHEASPGRRPH